MCRWLDTCYFLDNCMSNVRTSLLHALLLRKYTQMSILTVIDMMYVLCEEENHHFLINDPVTLEGFEK